MLRREPSILELGARPARPTIREGESSEVGLELSEETGLHVLCVRSRGLKPCHQEFVTIGQLPHEPATPMADRLAEAVAAVLIKTLLQSSATGLAGARLPDVDDRGAGHPRGGQLLQSYARIPLLEPSGWADPEEGRGLGARPNNDVDTRPRGHSRLWKVREGHEPAEARVGQAVRRPLHPSSLQDGPTSARRLQEPLPPAGPVRLRTGTGARSTAESDGAPQRSCGRRPSYPRHERMTS
jgi:hypothetical protein